MVQLLAKTFKYNNIKNVIQIWQMSSFNWNNRQKISQCCWQISFKSTEVVFSIKKRQIRGSTVRKCHGFLRIFNHCVSWQDVVFWFSVIITLLDKLPVKYRYDEYSRMEVETLPPKLYLTAAWTCTSLFFLPLNWGAPAPLKSQINKKN